MDTTPSPSGRRPNRRGLAAREHLLTTALRLLSTGRPDTVSVNLVAKEAGLSWGSVQNQFGDSDGFWASVIEAIIAAGPDHWAEPVSDDVTSRVEQVTELYRRMLDSPVGTAVENLRAGLPRPLDVLAETHPRTAAALAELDRLWEQAFLHFLEGLEFDRERALDVAAVVPSALRGLQADQRFGTTVDVERAHRTLVAALTSYLQG
ncbi:TetR/AcrR family transcriptional regulator [Nocardioides sp. SYSU DS0651]|uniref:TetR/AcrR family transcriptional regulator n=1 Tax=Nocardioides sp. SYSU DS0651 TaxID=3415955 RepID=UPI003F4BDA2E